MTPAGRAAPGPQAVQVRPSRPRGPRRGRRRRRLRRCRRRHRRRPAHCLYRCRLRLVPGPSRARRPPRTRRPPFPFLLVFGVGGGDLFGGHGQAGHRRGSAGVERLAEQERHGVAGVVGQGAVEGDVGERAVAVLPGDKGEQGRGGGGIAGPGQGGEVGPQPQVGLAVLREHAGPGVVAYLQALQVQGEPGGVLVRLEFPAGPVQVERAGDRLQALLEQRPTLRPVAVALPGLGNHPRAALPGGARGLAHGVSRVPGDRGDGCGQRLAGRQDQRRVPAGDGVRRQVELRPLGRAACGIRADVRPVAAVLNAQRLPHGDPGPGEPCAQCLGRRGNHAVRAVTDRVGLLDALRGEDARGVPGYYVGALRAGDVVAERERDSGTGLRGAEHHDARLGRLELEQDRDGGQQAGRGADADDLRVRLGTGNMRPVGAELGPGILGTGNGHGSETLLGWIRLFGS